MRHEDLAYDDRCPGCDVCGRCMADDEDDGGLSVEDCNPGMRR